jgi:hypothetical protein
MKRRKKETVVNVPPKVIYRGSLVDFLRAKQGGKRVIKLDLREWLKLYLAPIMGTAMVNLTELGIYVSSNVDLAVSKKGEGFKRWVEAELKAVRGEEESEEGGKIYFLQSQRNNILVWDFGDGYYTITFPKNLFEFKEDEDVDYVLEKVI